MIRLPTLTQGGSPSSRHLTLQVFLLAFPECFFADEMEFLPLAPRSRELQPQFNDWQMQLFKSDHGLRFVRHRSLPYFMYQQKRSKHIAGVTSVYTDRAFEDMTRTELDKLLCDPDKNVRKKVMSGLRGYTAKTVGTAGYHHDNYGKMVAYSDAYCYFYGATNAMFATLTSPDAHSCTIQQLLMLLDNPDLSELELQNIGSWEERFDRLSGDPRGAEFACASLMMLLAELVIPTMLGVDLEDVMCCWRAEWQKRLQGVSCNVTYSASVELGFVPPQFLC
jgi:hypothetical protein